MVALKGPEQVYRHFIGSFGFDEDGDPYALGLFSFALVEKDKFDWIEHRRCECDGIAPAAAEIEHWYADKPGSYFEDKGRQALDWYSDFARNLLHDEIEAQKQEAIQAYIGDRLKFMPQLYNNLTANFMFLFLIGLITLFVLNDFSPVAWVRHHFFDR
ncbi:MAG: hypothetical protein P4L90_27605 [Rhodopila sp.]|nr:hypothetical protein [Rhodopila sp.]